MAFDFRRNRKQNSAFRTVPTREGNHDGDIGFIVEIMDWNFLLDIIPK